MVIILIVHTISNEDYQSHKAKKKKKKLSSHMFFSFLCSSDVRKRPIAKPVLAVSGAVIMFFANHDS